MLIVFTPIYPDELNFRHIIRVRCIVRVTEGGRCHEMVGDPRRKNELNPLKENKLGVYRALFDAYNIPLLRG